MYKADSWVRDRYINLQEDLCYINEEACCSLNNESCVPLKLNLDDIVAIALENNFDLLLKDQEYDIQFKFAIRDQLKMLPQLITNGEISSRNNELIVSSISVDPTVPPAPPSISTEPHVQRYDITLILNLLDFGLSYYKAQQESKRIFMVALEYEVLRQKLVLDLTRQYWNAVAAKVALDEAEALLGSISEFRRKISNQMADRYVSKLPGLKNEADLIKIQIQFNGFRQEYYNAMSELTLLMGLPPCVKFELEYDVDRPQEVEIEDICTLERMALMQRPELYSRDVEERIAEDEVRYAFLQMLPGIELFSGNYFDANRFFTFKQWIVAGARATWNLFALPHRYEDMQASRSRKDLVKMHRIALSVGVLSQLRLAYILYKENFDQYSLAHSLEENNASLLQAAKRELEGGVISNMEVLIIRTEALFSKKNALKAFGELQLSLEQINHAIGSPRYYKSVQTVGE